MGKNDWAIDLKKVPYKKIYSQFNEDGLLEYIFKPENFGTYNKFFVEFGAGNGYFLSNTRFLKENGWDGIMLDADNKGNDEVKKEFITAENINSILKKYNCPQKFDLLSIDIDGNDYYVIKELCREFKPRIILAEFNGTIPEGIAKTIKYNPNHVWNNDEYYGFSYSAAFILAKEINYTIFYHNHSTNIWFVDNNEISSDFKINLPNFVHFQYHPINLTGEWVILK